MLAALCAMACASRPPFELPHGAAGTRVWRQARSELASLRTRLAPRRPYRMNVTLELEQRDLPTRMRARGAVAVRPGSALRMLLLGPGGTTALDLWVCGDRFRFAIPAIDLVRRGDATTPKSELRGLPVAFLRWWFLRPLEGRLLSFVDEPKGRRYVVRDDSEVVHVTDGAGRLEARRVSIGDEETLDSDGACGTVHYRQKSTGIELAVHCESVGDAPPERAFVDPDDPSKACHE